MVIQLTKINLKLAGTSRAAQLLRLHASSASGAGLIPGQRTKIPHAVWHGQKTKIRTKKKNPQKYLKLKKKTKSLFKVTTSAKLQDKKPFETTTGLSNKGHS